MESGGRNLPALAVAATASGSLVFGVGFDADKAAARTLPAGQAIVRQWIDRDANCTFWLQGVNDPLQVGDIATIGITGPVRDPWNLVAIEIVPR